MELDGLKRDGFKIDIALLIGAFLTIAVGLSAAAWFTRGFEVTPPAPTSTAAPTSTYAPPSLK